MITADSVKAKIQNLILMANAATKHDDADLTRAIKTLISGYANGDAVTDLGNKLYSFGAISDVHVPYGNGAEDLRRTISVLQNAGADFICIAGDIGSGSTVGELQSYKTIVDEVATVSLYSCTGNHDKSHTNENWNTYVGHDLNYVFEYQDDVFILFSFATAGNTTATEDSPYGEDNLEWLRTQLNIYQGRRIFLFMHYPLSGYSGLKTGSYYGFSSASTEDDSIMNMMNSVQNVMHFSGHTHFYFGVEESYDNINVIQMNFNNCATVHIPSSNYPRDVNGNPDDTGSQGYIVSVYENGVVLKAMDFVAGVYLDGYEYYLPIKRRTTEIKNSLMISASSIVVSEGGAESFTVRLLRPITENVTVSLTADNSNVTIDKTELTFTPDNYSEPQTVTITAPEDDDDADGYSVITVSCVECVRKAVSITVSDNDTVSEGIQLVWTNQYIGTDGAYSGNSGYSTEPFSVSGMSELPIFSDSAQVNGSNATSYVYFYTDNAVGTDTFVSRVVLTLDEVTVVPVPDGANYAVLRSVKQATSVLTLEEIKDCMYLTIAGLDGYVDLVATDAINVDEGGTATFAVKLGTPINFDATIRLYCDNNYISLDKAELLFTPENYGVEQIVNISDVSYFGAESAVQTAIIAKHHGKKVKHILVTIQNTNTDGLLWETGNISDNGSLVDNDASYFCYRTLPFPVTSGDEIKIYVDSDIGGTSNVYCYFYSSEECSDSTLVSSRNKLTTGKENQITVPDGAAYIIIRSPNGAATPLNVTLADIGYSIYLV